MPANSVPGCIFSPSMNGEQQHAGTINRLTALWALCESGLGGWLFALKIPLTGFLVGGFAVLIISLICWYSKGSAKTLLSSLVLVLLVKATVSPHAPLPAYLAVSFQGVAGLALFRLIPHFRLATLLLGILAMLESAFQKLIVLTIIFGNALWEAINQLWKGIVKDFPIASGKGSWYVIGIYGGIYLLWGIVVGLWAGRLPRLLEEESGRLMDSYREHPALIAPTRKPERRRKNKWLPLVLILVAIMAVFLARDRIHTALYVLLRSVVVTAALYVVLLPLGRRLLQRWTRKAEAGKKKQLQDVLDYLPVLRGHIVPAWQFCAAQYKGLRRYRNFILLMILISLQPAPDAS